MAVWNSRAAIAVMLIAAGADINKRSNQGQSVIDVAVEDGNAQILQLFGAIQSALEAQ
jgi:ankyrin repeat protein